MSGAYSLRHLKTRFNAASAPQIAAGAQWYRQAQAFAQALSRRSGDDLDTVCQVIAVLSPACRWERNQRDAANLLLSAQPDSVPVSTYSFNRDKAVRILRGQARLEPGSPDEPWKGEARGEEPPVGAGRIPHRTAGPGRIRNRGAVQSWWEPWRAAPWRAVADAGRPGQKESLVAWVRAPGSTGRSRGAYRDPRRDRKIYSFYRNLLDPDDPAYVTIDRHAWWALWGLSGGGGVRITGRQYRLATEAYVILPEDHIQHPVQAILNRPMAANGLSQHLGIMSKHKPLFG